MTRYKVYLVTHERITSQTVSPLCLLFASSGFQRHHLEARFRKLYRAIAQLGEEKKGRKDMPRETASRRRSSSTSKNHFEGACWTSGGESCLETRSTSIPETLSRGQSAFREALDEAREILGVRKSHSGVVAASIREAFPACKTRLSVQDESANISVSYEETNQTTSSPPKLAGSMGGSSSTYESGRKEKGTEHFLCSKSRWPRNRPQETSRKQPGAQTQHHRSLCSTRSTNPTPRRVKTVYVGAKRGGSNGKSLKVRLQLNNENSPETSSSECNASNKGISKDKNSGTRKTAPCRSAPLHQGLRTMNSLKDNDHSKQRKRAGRYESSEESRESGDRDNERRCSRWQEKQRGATQRKSRVVDGGHREIEPDGKERHVAYEGGSNIRGSWKQQYFDNSSGEEIEEDAGDQQRWRNRGRVLWSTHAEPAARATSTGSTRAASHKVRSHSQPATRPYYGLYARSLRANGIDPTNFRASRWGYDAAGLSCAEAQEHVDGSLLWRGNRGDDPFAAKRARAPTDGLPDRLEAGRVLDSFNRRAELLGTMPPTPLRTKAAWMETPGDPEYRYTSKGRVKQSCGLCLLLWKKAKPVCLYTKYRLPIQQDFSSHTPDKQPARYLACL